MAGGERMRCLITGGEGFLGANLARELIAQGHEVTVTSLHRQNKTSLGALGVLCRTEYGDVTDYSFVERVLSSTEAEWVFHLAAVSIVRIASRSPLRTLNTNIIGTANVLEVCTQLGIERVLVASSDKAYGDQGGIPYREDMPLKPTGVYEVSKACADNIAGLYDAIVLRCANIYGEGDLNFSRLIPNSFRLGWNNESPQIYGDAVDARREWLYVEDAVNAYITLAKVGKPGAYNVGSGDQASPLEIGKMISDITGSLSPEWVRKENEFYEIKEQVLNCEKILSLGWKPFTGIMSGLYKTGDWYKEYFKCG
jgi:CDP-glucose 4,6-dehydratase